MFDKLIESNSVGAEFKPRRKFFMMSSVVVGILFFSAVVFSLYAQNIDLGTDSFELVQILAPVETDVPEPEPPRRQSQQTAQHDTSDVPIRRTNTARIDEFQPTPTEISTTRNTEMSRPEGRFKVDPKGVEGNRAGGAVGETGNPGGGGSADSGPEVSEVVRTGEPPPIARKESKKPTIVTKGVVNGTAISLPKPPYPPTAKAIGVTGDVNVQVLIDEHGRVVSAKAVTGHVTLKAEAERAAWRARFEPTYLSNVAVKVTGVIVYRFTK